MSNMFVRTVGRPESGYATDDEGLLAVADDLANDLEGGDYALFYSPDELTGIALHDRGDYLMIYLFVYYPQEEIWVRNSPGLVEIRVPGDWEDAWEALAYEVLKTMPNFEISEAEEIPAECVGGEDMGECWPE